MKFVKAFLIFILTGLIVIAAHYCISPRAPYLWKLAGAHLRHWYFTAYAGSHTSQTGARRPLFHRMGGISQLQAIINEFMASAGGDPRLEVYFPQAGASKRNALLLAAICRATDGRPEAPVGELQSVFVPLKLTTPDFEVLLEHAVVSADKFGIPPLEKAELLAALAAVKPALAVYDTSLYARLGGKGRIINLVDDFVNRMVADRLARNLPVSIQPPRLKAMLVNVICHASGGPCPETDPAEALAWGDLYQEEALLVKAWIRILDQVQLPERHIDEFLARVGSALKSMKEALETGPGFSSPAVVLAVRQDFLKQYFLDPIVIVAGGMLHDPFNLEYSSIFDYCPPGKVLRLLSGGALIGEASPVTVQPEDPFYMRVRIVLRAVHQSENLAGVLATNFDPAIKKARVKRVLNGAERIRVLPLAQDLFRNHGVADSLLGRIKVVQQIATNLDADSFVECVGSFVLSVGADSAQFADRHILFLIAELGPEALSYPNVVEHYEYEKESQSGIFERMFVDQLDWDGDGVDEIFVRTGSEKMYEYEIYKRRKEGWQRIYHGGGGGC